MQTTHWGIIGTFLIPLGSAIASNFCGHTVDLSTMSWTAEGASIVVTIVGFLNEHFGIGQTQQQTSSPSTTPVSSSSPAGLTPDG